MSYRYQSRAIPILYQTSWHYFSETGAKLLSRMSFIQWRCTFLITGENMFCFSLSRFHFVRRRGAQKQICHNKRLRMFRLYTGVGDRWGLTLCVDSEVHFQVFRLPAFSHSLDLSSWALSVSFSIRFLTPFFSYPSLFTPPCLSVVFFSQIFVPFRLTNAGSVRWDNFYFIFKI